jgi:TRAP-type C4-dicarboxylate transport system permease small subunit
MIQFIKVLGKFERLMATAFMGIMTLLVIFDVFTREVFNTGLPWAQKSAVYLMIWGALLGAVMVSEKAAHLRPEIADKLWGEKGKVLFVRVQNLFIIIFCLIFIYASFLYVSESYSFGDKNVILQVPLWILQLIIPYTFISMSIRSLYFLFNPHEQLAIKREFS